MQSPGPRGCRAGRVDAAEQKAVRAAFGQAEIAVTLEGLLWLSGVLMLIISPNP